MVMCKIKCPSCGADHDVSIDMLSSAKTLECTLCGNEVSLKSDGKGQSATTPKKSQSQKKMATQRKSAVSSSKRKTVGKSSAKRKKSKGESTKYVVNLCIGGLALIIFLVLIVKLSGSKGSTETELAQQKENVDLNLNEQKIVSFKHEANDQKSSLKDMKNAAIKAKPEVESGESVVLEGYASANLEVQESEGTPVFGGGGSAEVEEVEPQQHVIVTQTEVVEPVAAVSEAPSTKTILEPSEQSEMEELNKLPSYEMTDEEKTRLTELKNKYLWFKANRFKLTREQMEYEWDRRWAAIEDANKMAKSRSDAMLPRPLQILLAKAKSQKERAYMMRIYQKPISFEEKEMVRKARGQAIWERRKLDGPMRYPEDKKKKKNKKYIDEYGYEYYLDDSGQRVYL